jgi:AraC-like DNA-binding protein
MPIAPPSALRMPVESILLVDEITRTEAVSFRAMSTPGHLLHLVESGVVHQWAEGRLEKLRPGDLVWYHQGEPVEGRILKAPWRFITVGFLAPPLTPPPDEQRVVRAPPAARRALRELLQAWRSGAEGSAQRALHCSALLHQALRAVLPLLRPAGSEAPALSALSARWWTAEKWARQQLDQPLRLADLARQAGLSERSVVRACQAATGLPPARRLKVIRLHHARNLLQLTDLPVTEIALMTGYERVQELSRDIRKHFGRTPRTLRARSQRSGSRLG